MSEPEFGNLASLAVATAALLVSILSLRKTSKFNARQNDFAATAENLNRLLIERETAEGVSSKRADLSANLYERSKNDYRLKVFNRGRGVAKNVRIIDLDTAKRSLLQSDEIAEKFPIPILEQHQSVDLLAAVTLASHLRTHVKLIWNDETGDDHEKELTPSL